MKNFLLTNRCTKIRVKTSDNHTLKVFSVFYQHPALLHPDGWKLLNNEDKKDNRVDLWMKIPYGYWRNMFVNLVMHQKTAPF